MPGKAYTPLAERFWANVQVGNPNECWPYLLYRRETGHGSFRVRDLHAQGIVKSTAASSHRVAWYLHSGKWPANIIVRHKCDNAACCNPNHLELGTHQDNVADRVKRDRSARGESVGSSKLTERDVRAIRKRYDKGWKMAALAHRYGVNKSTISQIVHRITWEHVS